MTEQEDTWVRAEGSAAMLLVRTILFCAVLVMASGVARSEAGPEHTQLVLETVEYPTVGSEWVSKAPLIEAALVLALDGHDINLRSKRAANNESGKVDQPLPSIVMRGAAGSQDASSPDQVRYVLSVRIEARNGTLQLGGSLSQERSRRAADDIDIEPVKAEEKELFRAIGVFASNIAMAIKKLDEDESDRHKYKIAAGCFGGLDDVDPAVLEYASRVPAAIGAYLTGGKQFVGRSETPGWSECKGKPPVQQILLKLQSDAVIWGIINRSGELMIVQPMLQGNRAWEYLPLPELRVVATEPFDSNRVATYSKQIVAYLDGILGRIGSAEFQTFSGLPVAELLTKARDGVNSRDEGERLYAAALLELAIIRAPSNPEPYFVLGELRYRQKQDEEAMELLKTALTFGWETSQSGMLLKQLYLRNGLYEKARKLCGEIPLEADAGAKNRCLGETYLAERDLDRAFAAYSSAVSEAPDVADGFYNLGLVEEAKRDTDRAVEYYSRALAKDKNFGPAKGKLAATKYFQGIQAASDEKYSVALGYFSDALNFSSSPLIYFQRGMVYTETGDKESDGQQSYRKAINDFKAAQDGLGDTEAVLLWLPWLIPDLGELLIVVGEPKEARKLVSSIVPRLNSDTPVRYGTDWKLVKLIFDYIQFSAATLMGEDTRVAEKVLYSVMYEVDLKKAGWSFTTMRKYLGGKYLREERGDQLKVKKERADRILRFINTFEERKNSD